MRGVSVSRKTNENAIKYLYLYRQEDEHDYCKNHIQSTNLQNELLECAHCMWMQVQYCTFLISIHNWSELQEALNVQVVAV